MNTNLLVLLDEACFAPTEIKADILSTLISEGCFTRRDGTATLVGSATVKIAAKIIGIPKMKKIYKNYFVTNPQVTESEFSLVLSTLINKEPLPLIQDFLYALYLSGWEYNVKDMKDHYANGAPAL